MASRGKVLIIDDDESIRVGCAQTLEQSGFSIDLAADGEQGVERAARESFDVALLDLMMPGMSGMEVLQKLRQDCPHLMVIIITGYATIDSAVEAIKHGAYNYLPKPFTPEALTATVLKAANAGRRAMEDACINQELERKMLSDNLIGRSEGMRNVGRLIRKAAPTDSTVLITGETGVGKEVVARAIHRLSRRSEKPFVTVDCGTLVESLFESELFGHVKGAFSGAVESTVGKIELADGGTLFLDEIANISIQMQARLLRVVQEHEISRVGSTQMKKVDVRILSATNRDLLQAVRDGNFREDLYYRLNVIHLAVPPLRDRLEDIPALVAYYVRKIAAEKRRPIPTISEEAMRFLKRHEWPGNVRELINALEYAVVTCEGTAIGTRDLPYAADESSVPWAAGSSSPEEGQLARIEQNEILRALQQFGGNRTRTAEYLGINRKTLREKIRKYDLENCE
jgi:DNA-binding NtrC family response regulator